MYLNRTSVFYLVNLDKKRNSTIPYAKNFFVFLFIKKKKKNIYQKTYCAGSYCFL